MTNFFNGGFDGTHGWIISQVQKSARRSVMLNRIFEGWEGASVGAVLEVFCRGAIKAGRFVALKEGQMRAAHCERA